MSSIRQRPPTTSSNQPTTTPLQLPENGIQEFSAPPRQAQSALSQALESSSHLANLLPTGTVLAFQLLIPIFTNNGSCDAATRPMTLILLVILSLSCFLASFTDSVKASNGHVYHGFATFRGLWLFDSPNASSSGIPDLRKYRMNFLDVVHASLSVFVFVSIALKDKNVMSCLYPNPGHEVQEVLYILPFGIGLISSLLFVVFPTRRHGIGYPVSRER